MTEFAPPSRRPSRARGIKAPTTPDAVEMAMEAESGDTSPDSPAQRFLRKQEILTDEQVRLTRSQRRSEDMGAALKVLTGIAGLAVTVALGAAVWSAAHANNLVIEAFSVPPALAERGITGEALARQLNDDLAANSRIASSGERQRGLSGGWAKSLSVEIPSTGISLSQLDQWLRDKLGHQSHVSGEVMVAPDGTLMLAARSGSEGLPPLKGAEGDLSSLIHQTAEAVYAREQFDSYADYLTHQERWEDALVWARSQETLPNAYRSAGGYLTAGNVLRVLQGDLATIEPYRRAMATDPAQPTPFGNLAGVEYDLGHPESAWRLYQRALPRARADRTVVAEARRQTVARHRGRAARALGDWREVRVQQGKNLGKILLGSMNATNNSALFIAQADAAMHDIRQAQADLDGFELATPNDVTNKLQAAGHVRNSAQDWTGAIAVADALVADYHKLPDKGRERYYAPVWKARALAHLGRAPEAQGLIGATRLDCQPCVAARGEIAAIAGDARIADQWFSEAVRMAPSIPFANTDWGRVLLDRGETDKAVERLSAANRQSPHFADPISLWGEALLKQGKAKAAIAKFREADKYAPKWARNHLFWGEALAAQGKVTEAKAQFTAAAGMDLTPDERARLATHLGGKS